MEQGLGAAGVELGEHVVEEEDGHVVESVSHQAVGGQAQGKGHGPLFALGRVGAGGHGVDAQGQIVAMRAD